MHKRIMPMDVYVQKNDEVTKITTLHTDLKKFGSWKTTSSYVHRILYEAEDNIILSYLLIIWLLQYFIPKIWGRIDSWNTQEIHLI